MKGSFLFLLLFLAGTVPGLCQTDTSFWFTAPSTPPALSNSPVELQLQTFSGPATIRIRQPANPAGVDITLNLDANTTTFVNPKLCNRKLKWW